MIFSLLFSLLKCSCEETDDINGLIDKSCSPESCAKRQLDSSEKNNGVYKCCYINMVDEDGVKIRKDENYEKNYLLGKYGAIPTLKHFDMFKGE